MEISVIYWLNLNLFFSEIIQLIIDMDSFKNQLKIIYMASYFRLLWYKKTMFEKLLHIKHFLIIIVALCVPSISILVTLLTYPILQIVHPENQHWHYLLVLFAVQLIYFGWVFLQKEAIYPSYIQNYFSSLPISLNTKCYIDSIVLLLGANNLLLIPLIVATFNLANFIEVIRFIIFFISILILQIGFFYRKFFTICLTFIIDLLLYISAILQNKFLLFCSILTTILIEVFFISLLNWNIKNLKIRTLTFSGVEKINFLKIFKKNPLLIFIVSIITRKYLSNFLLRITAIIIIIALSFYWITSNQVFNVFPIITAVISLIVFLISKIDSFFKEERYRYAVYFNSLPIKQINFYLLENILLISISIFFIAGYFGLLIIMQKLSFLSSALLFILIFPLHILFCFIRNKFPKQCTWISFIVIGLLIALATNI